MLDDCKGDYEEAIADELSSLSYLDVIWRFPEMGIPPNHPFIDCFLI